MRFVWNHTTAPGIYSSNKFPAINDGADARLAPHESLLVRLRIVNGSEHASDRWPAAGQASLKLDVDKKGNFDGARSPLKSDDERVVAAPAAWFVCTGVSCATSVPWNGTKTVPFLGSFANVSGCEAACEALPSCTTFCFGGSTPHVDPQGRDWHNRCYGR